MYFFPTKIVSFLSDHCTNQMASLQSSSFTFLDENHILFPGPIDDGLYVYDVRAMPPINTRKQKLRGTHCFETSVPQSLVHEAVCTVNITCNSIATGENAAVGRFYTNYDDRMVLLRVTTRSDLMRTHVNWRQEHHEVHVRAQLLLTWMQKHPAPPNACVVVPWSAWAPTAARMVVPRIDGNTIPYTCPSQSEFPGCGMRIVSSPSVQSDGTIVVAITDYHPARVFRGREQNALPHTDTISTEVKAEFGHNLKTVIADAERGKQRVQDGVYPRLRSKSAPLPTVRVLFSLFTSLAYRPRISQLSMSPHPSFIPCQRWR